MLVSGPFQHNKFGYCSYNNKAIPRSFISTTLYSRALRNMTIRYVVRLDNNNNNTFTY